MVAVPQMARMLPQSMARAGVYSGIKRSPWTTLSSTAALAIFLARLSSQAVGSLGGVCAKRLPSAMEKMDAPSGLHLREKRCASDCYNFILETNLSELKGFLVLLDLALTGLEHRKDWSEIFEQMQGVPPQICKIQLCCILSATCRVRSIG